MLERVSGEGITAPAQKVARGEIIDTSALPFEEVLLLLFMQSGSEEQEGTVNPTEIKTGETGTQTGKRILLENLIKVAVNTELPEVSKESETPVIPPLKGELTDPQKLIGEPKADGQVKDKVNQREEEINLLLNSEEVPKEKPSLPQTPSVKPQPSEISIRQIANGNRKQQQEDTGLQHITESLSTEEEHPGKVAGSMAVERQETQGQKGQGLADNKTPLPNQPVETKAQKKELPPEHRREVYSRAEDSKDIPTIKQKALPEQDSKPYIQIPDQRNQDPQQEGQRKEVKTLGSEHRSQPPPNHPQVFQSAQQEKVEEVFTTTKKDMPTTSTKGERSVNIRVEDTELSFRFSTQNHNVSVEVRARNALENYITFLDAGRLQRNLQAIGVNLESLKINGIELSVRNSRATKKEWKERDIIDRSERSSEKAGSGNMHSSGLNLLL